ncbi:MAG: TonB-dependent receptor [Pseudomonadota bacterium]
MSTLKARFGLKAALSMTVGLTGLMAAPVFAQEAGEEAQESRRLNTVTITATKREQTLQDVPVAVSVVDAQVLEEAQLNDIIDLQSVVPTLRVSQLQQSGNTTFSIRGFGNGANNIGIEPAVAVFIDGVYRTRAAGGLSDYADVERIEVLRGPQSTLFGKNASVGVINVVTKAPEYDWAGNVEATLGNYNQSILKGYVTGPLVEDQLAFSIGGSVNQRDGYADNVTLGTKLNDRDRFSLKGQLLFEPNDDLSVRFIADYDKLDEVCCYTPNAINGPAGQAIQFAFDPTFTTSAILTDPFAYETALDLDPVNEITNQGISAQIDYDTAFGTVTSITSFRTQESFSDGDVDFSALRAVQSNVNDYTIDTFTQEVRLAGEVGNLSYLAGGFYFNEEVDLFSDVIYADQFYNFAAISAAAGDLSLPAIENALGFGPRTFFAPGTGSEENFLQENESYSLFAQGDYTLFDRLTATLGVSYISDEKTVSATANSTDVFASLDLATLLNDPTVISAATGVAFADIVASQAFLAVTGNEFTPAGLQALQVAAGGGDAQAIATLTAIGQTSANPAFQAGVASGTSAAIAAGLRPLQFLPGFLDFPNAIEGDTTEDDKVTVTARLAFDVNDNINLYGSYATGFKASSWNLTRDSSYFASDAAALGSAGLIPTNRAPGTRFSAPEEVEVFEIGAKLNYSTFSLNVALFDQSVENFQASIFQGAGFVLSNADKQSTTGFEWDATWSPIDPVTLTFAGVVQDPTYDEFEGGPVVFGSERDLEDGVADGAGDLTGTTPAGIPETSLVFAGNFDFDLTDSVSGFIRADYIYESEVTLVENLPDSLSREVGTINASVGLSFPGDVDVTVWGRNLNEDEYFTSGFPTVAQPGSFNVYVNAPLTYGVTLRKTF